MTVSKEKENKANCTVQKGLKPPTSKLEAQGSSQGIKQGPITEPLLKQGGWISVYLASVHIKNKLHTEICPGQKEKEEAEKLSDSHAGN